MTDEIALALRIINLALLAALAVGMAAGWWQHRGDRVDPLGLALGAFVGAGLYSTAEAIAITAPPGGRPLAVTAAAVVALICVYLPLIAEHRRRPRPDRRSS